MNIGFKRYGTLLAASILLLLLASCSDLSIQKNTQESSTTTTSDMTPQTAGTENEIVKLPSLKETFSAIPKKFTENEEFKMCAQSNLDMCIQQISYQDSIEVSCDDYLLETNKISCKNTRIMQQAKDSRDLTLCDQLGEQKDSCRFELVTAQGIETDDVKVCSDLSDRYMLACNNRIIQLKAIKIKDVKVCEDIKNLDDNGNMEKEFCINEVKNTIEMEKSTSN